MSALERVQLQRYTSAIRQGPNLLSGLERVDCISLPILQSNLSIAVCIIFWTDDRSELIRALSHSSGFVVFPLSFAPPLYFPFSLSLSSISSPFLVFLSIHTWLFAPHDHPCRLVYGSSLTVDFYSGCRRSSALRSVDHNWGWRSTRNMASVVDLQTCVFCSSRNNISPMAGARATDLLFRKSRKKSATTTTRMETLPTVGTERALCAFP